MNEEEREIELAELVRYCPDKAVEMLLNWERELSKVMPADFKDWWQNSREEWPLIARLAIESAREKEELAWDMLNEREF